MFLRRLAGGGLGVLVISIGALYTMDVLGFNGSVFLGNFEALDFRGVLQMFDAKSWRITYVCVVAIEGGQASTMEGNGLFFSLGLIVNGSSGVTTFFFNGTGLAIGLNSGATAL